MIFDDIRAVSPGFRRMTQGSHVIRVPWEVCPLTTEPDGILGLYWRGWDALTKKLIPRTENNEVDCSWWRPPHEKIIIMSEKHERGCLFVWTNPEDKAEDSLTGIKTKWTAQVSLVALNLKGAPISLLTMRVYDLGGKLADWSGGRSTLTAFIQECLMSHDAKISFQASNDSVTLIKSIEENWAARPDELALDVGNILGTFAMTCAMMCCKNIIEDEFKPDEKLQKARVRRGNLPLVSWHVLKIKMGGHRRSVGHSAGTGEPLAAHWVRGHFKTFTKDKPLLGRAVGTYWWGPHIAGRADRVVHKDYQLSEE